MIRVRDVVAAAILTGFAVASIAAGLSIETERYLALGLEQLALEVWAAALLRYLPVALAGALCAALLVGLQRVAVPTGLVARLSRAGAWLAALLPAIAWAARRNPALLPREPLLAIAGAALGLALLWLALRAIARRPRLLRGLRAALLASAIASLALSIAAVTASRFARGRTAGPEARPNILLIVLDTVRADRISAYGYVRPTTPELDDFAREAVRYSDFYATSPWTVPSHASLFTGLYAATHGATQERMTLDHRFATLAEILRDEGYTTWAASGNPWLGRGVELTQGFESYIETWRYDLSVGHHHPPDVTHPANRAFARFLDGVDDERPFFAFVNFMDAHMPYSPPEPFLSRFLADGTDPRAAFALGRIKWVNYYRGRPYTEADLATLSDLYDGGVAYVSAAVGTLLDELAKRGLADDTLVVITADHGELFGESGSFGDTGLLGHMFGLYNATLRIPLMIRHPDGYRAGEVDRRMGQLVDLFPTLLGAAGVDASRFDHRGRDLLGDPKDARESVFAEYYFPRFALAQFSAAELESQAERIGPFQRRLRSVQRHGFRLIWSSDGRHELYNLRADPRETRNLLDAENRSPVSDEFFEMLRSELDHYPRPFGSEGPGAESGETPAGLDDETREALEAVGYVR